MATQLTTFETGLLNRIIPTQTLSDSKGVQVALRSYIGDEKDNIIAEQKISEAEFRTLQSQSVKNIFQFLREQQFIGEREGGVNFLTEKGKHLRKQGSIEKYELWRKEVRKENRVVLHTIETRGYLDQDEVNRNRRAAMLQRIKKFVLYPILLIILLAFLVVGAHHYKLDDNIPFIKNLFDKEQASKDNDINDDSRETKKTSKSVKDKE